MIKERARALTPTKALSCWVKDQDETALGAHKPMLDEIRRGKLTAPKLNPRACEDAEDNAPWAEVSALSAPPPAPLWLSGGRNYGRWVGRRLGSWFCHHNRHRVSRCWDRFRRYRCLFNHGWGHSVCLHLGFRLSLGATATSASRFGLNLLYGWKFNPDVCLDRRFGGDWGGGIGFVDGFRGLYSDSLGFGQKLSLGRTTTTGRLSRLFSLWANHHGLIGDRCLDGRSLSNQWRRHICGLDRTLTRLKWIKPDVGVAIRSPGTSPAIGLVGADIFTHAATTATSAAAAAASRFGFTAFAFARIASFSTVLVVTFGIVAFSVGL